MSELSKNGTESDVESNSSWTLLNEETNENVTDRPEIVQEEPPSDEPAVKTEECLDEIKAESETPKEDDKKTWSMEVQEDDLQSLSTVSNCSINSLSQNDSKDKIQEYGCLTFEEFLNERELQHDYEYDEKASVWERIWDKKKTAKPKYKKCKAKNVATLKIIGAVLSIAGISFMCMMAPSFKGQAVTKDLQTKLDQNFTQIETDGGKGGKIYLDYQAEEAVRIKDRTDILKTYMERSCANRVCTKTGCQRLKCDDNDSAKPYSDYLKSTEKKHKRQNVFKDGKIKAAKSDKKDETKKIEKLRELGNDCRKPSRNEKNAKSRTEKSIKNRLEKGEKKNGSDVHGDVVEKEIKSDDKLRRRNKVKKVASEINVKKTTGKKAVKLVPTRPVQVDRVKQIENENVKKEDSWGILKRKQFTENLIQNKKIKQDSVKNVDQIVLPIAEDKAKVDGDTPPEIKGTICKKTMPALFIGPQLADDSEPVKNETPSLFFLQSDFIACNLIHDVLMLKLTSKLREKAKATQKKLKRRLEKRNKTVARSIKHDDEDKSTNLVVTNSNFFNQSVPKIEATPKPNEIKKSSNFDLLKELPFNTTSKDDVYFYTGRPRTRQERDRDVSSPTRYRLSDDSLRETRAILQRIMLHAERNRKISEEKITHEPFIFRGLDNEDEDEDGVEKPKQKISELIRHRSKTYLEELKRKRAERIKLLEQMRRENRSKIDAIIKERNERIKRDVASGVYQVPFPEYKDVSEQLKKIKRRSNNGGFIIDSSSSSDSDATITGHKTKSVLERYQRTPESCPNVSNGSVEHKYSNEFMVALKVGKKVSNTFREWTLKKAPTLTCLKNYCNSKVSQISEKLTNQLLRENEDDKHHTVEKEELETLKSRKEKHEQLKRFWRAKQQYLDKRIEICELLKERLSGSKICEAQDEEKNETLSQGVQILDSIITDVLRTVKLSKSFHEKKNYGTFDNNVKVVSKSVSHLAPKPDFDLNGGNHGALVPVTCSGKTPSDALYDWLFEKRAMEIKNRDRTLWKVQKPDPVGLTKTPSKQDPSKGFHEKILKRHN